MLAVRTCIVYSSLLQHALGFSISHAVGQAQVMNSALRHRAGAVRAQSRMASPTVVSVGLVGKGLVGAEFLAQVQQQQASLLSDCNVDVKVCGIVGSKQMVVDEQGLDVSDVSALFESKSVPTDLSALAASLPANAVVVDCTASDDVSAKYSEWLKEGVHVVTPNKKTGSGPLADYKACQSAPGQWWYETTVGAGLPIINVLKNDVMQTGDSVKKIEGIFSGTLSYIFNTFTPDKSFSAVIDDAKEKGFTEPDPREDLSGTDVQRKVVILAREVGLDLELDDVPVESLVPAELESWQPKEGENTADAFIKEMAAFDADKAALIKEATDNNQIVRFVGEIDVEAGTAKVGLQKLPGSHPFAGTQWADNIVSISTDRYQPRPLVVQGPGAGAAVTAAGVFADFLRLAKSL